ncbi:hypothetical protein [Nonomuraea turcica]|uniref:hypothetical protein n=1 Tax=Nonomuraea sp. G32 TaxID=3067274 RepID=UPI00273AF966|nr:hypothetical protein [Nonomuraea sp. G32]MDP4505334.1 hypothetical protein [Nonomuraea sp. G32]
MRNISRVLVAAGTAAAAVAMTASPAQASNDAIVHVKDCDLTYCPSVGYGHFNSDPVGSNYPGDALRACDTEPDGWGVKAWMLDSEGKIIRSATTQGYDSPYCTPWKTGDLPENMYVNIIVCKIKGTTTDGCRSGDGWA